MTHQVLSTREVARRALLAVVLLVIACVRVDKFEVRQDASQSVRGSPEVVWINVVDQLHDLGIEVNVPVVPDSKLQFTYQNVSMDLKVERGATSTSGAGSSVIHMTSNGGRSQMESLLETLVQYHRKAWNGSNQDK